MASRTSWEGYLRLNLLSVPVKAYTAASNQGGKIGFHLIHNECHSRIRYKKVCPVHGEVPNDEIVSGYEFAKGKYAIVDKEEVAKLRAENDKAITIDTFIRPGDLDPMYYGDRSYYLVPDGRVAQKPYAVLQRVMAEEERYAVALIVLSGREHAVLLRAVEGLFSMTLLNFEEQLKKPEEFADETPEVTVSDKELALARTLIAASTSKKFDFAAYEDRYTRQLTSLLQERVKGKHVVSEPHHEEPAVVNLMDALRQSLEQTKRGAAGKKPARAKRSAHAHQKHAAPKKGLGVVGRRKTG